MRYRLARFLMERFATHTLAASQVAGAALFGRTWVERGQVLLCGIDLEPFHETADRDDVRRELGLPVDAVVIGHAGGLFPRKTMRSW